jgi:large subunit ribosomal protein L10
VNRTEKEQHVATMRSDFSAVQGAVVADYIGLTVRQFNVIRKAFRDKGVTIKVLKNKLAQIAAQGTPLEVLIKDFKGPIALAYSHEDAIAPAKVATECAKSQEKFSIRCGYIDQSRLDSTGVEQLSKMPSKDELRSKLLATLMAPAQQLVSVMNAVPQQMVLVLAALQKKMEEGSESSESSESSDQ